MQRLPTVFLSHGSPMHALDAGGAGPAWRAIAESLPKPRAVLVASAHWETSLPMLTSAERPETIHDFSGFPAPLYRLQYAAPGEPALAQQATELLKGSGFTAAANGCRGLDHGAWVPLRWMYPDHDVPVVQVSVQPSLGTTHHLRLVAGDRGAVLAYRDRAPEAARAHPTEEHFLPLFIAWGAAGPTATAERHYAATEGVALSMDAYIFR